MAKDACAFLHVCLLGQDICILTALQLKVANMIFNHKGMLQQMHHTYFLEGDCLFYASFSQLKGANSRNQTQ